MLGHDEGCGLWFWTSQKRLRFHSANSADKHTALQGYELKRNEKILVQPSMIEMDSHIDEP